MTGGGERTVVVTGKQTAADGVVVITLADAAGRELAGWQPGAHVDLHLPGGYVRQYSLCGDPAQRRHYRLGVLREPDGRGGSAAVHDTVGVGDTLRIAGPRNTFPLVEARSYLFIAGGIGITPILPMVAAVSRQAADWRLVYGGRRRASMAFLDELARYGERVTVCPQDTHGLLDLDGLLGGPAPGTAVYCCGPEPLLRAVEQRCAAGAPHVERFSPKPVDRVSPERAFEVRLARTGRTVAVPAGMSILRALELGGVSVLSSCREGTCGTCETGVLAGVPDHRDSVLTGPEQEAGDIMMICVSRARSPELALDL
jgi:ferredoxin-NADP reductase